MADEQGAGLSEDQTVVLLKMLSDVAADNRALHNEIGRLQGELCSLKNNHKNHQDQLLDFERSTNERISGKRGDNGLAGRLAAQERRTAIIWRAMGGLGAVFVALTIWVWQQGLTP